MIFTLIVLGSLMVYFALGGAIALRCLPRFWTRADRRWSSWANAERYTRESVVAKMIVTTIFWPVLGPVEILLRSVDRTDPVLLQRENDEQRRRIRELERELRL